MSAINDFLSGERLYHIPSVRDELRALLTERDALASELAALKAAKAPARKLLEYKGVTFHDGKWWAADGTSYDKAANLIAIRHVVEDWDDADHAALLALKADPYEPVETVEDVLCEVVELWDTSTLKAYADRIRAAVHAEGAA